MRDEKYWTMDLLAGYDTSDLRQLYNKTKWEVTRLKQATKRNSRWNQQADWAALRRAEAAKIALSNFIVDTYQHTLANTDQKVDLSVDSAAKVFALCDLKITLIPKKKWGE